MTDHTEVPQSEHSSAPITSEGSSEGSSESSSESPAFPEIDAALNELNANKDRWVSEPLSRKIELLREVIAGVERSAESQVHDALDAKGIAHDSRLAAEDWLSGPYANLRVMSELLVSLESLETRGHTGVTQRDARELESGQVAVSVFPRSMLDRVLLLGFKAEVRLQPHVKANEWSERTALTHREPPSEGKIALVLGAGNVASIGSLDLIHKLYFESQVCILKFNPVNEYLAPHYAEIMRPLIEEGFVRLVKGGAQEGEYLCQHPLVEEIHITGSCRTHDAIVYGVGEEGAARKERDEPVCEKRISSELGNVSPVIVVPGVWTQREIKFHAANIATQMYNNSGFNCNATRVIIMHRDWPQRRALTDAILATLSDLEARRAYYPGAAERHERFMSSHSGAEAVRTRNIDDVEGALPVGLLVEVDAAQTDHLAFQEEAFCAFAATTLLDADDTPSFIRAATAFANDVVWGTLNATIIVDPRAQKRYSADIEHALDELRFGSVGLNHWPALSYGLGNTTWGAFPGHERQDIRSGIGVVHNTFMLEDVEKTVVRGPFVVKPTPPWFLTHKNKLPTARALLSATARPSVFNMLKLFANALRG